MNKEMLTRLMEAEKYQMMALKALFPKEAAAHIDVIRAEVKEILFECMESMIKNRSTENEKKEASAKNVSKVKKVNIEL